MKRSVTVMVMMAALLSPVFAAAPAKEDAPIPKLAIELGAPFRDNMVLQRGMSVPVWGWSQPGTTVTVEFAGQKSTAKAGQDGKWMLTLKDLKASFDPAEMTVTESTGKKVTLKNILVGEVWMASGQSNMQMHAGGSTCTKLITELLAATEGKVAPIREFEVKSVAAQLHPIEKAAGRWQNGSYKDYSAIAFAFAYKLYKELNVPVGILNCSWSSTQIEAWVPRQGWATAKDEYSEIIHQKCLQTDPTTPEHKEAWAAFYKSLNDQIAESEALMKNGKEALAIQVKVPGNMNSNRDASWLFNGRMSPVVPYAIRGAIWNQGWHNRNGGLTYYNNLHSLIRGWRIVWNKPELPVYFHQFYCPGDAQTGEPSIDTTAEMRLATWMARDIPNSGMASQIDIGGVIHYVNKAVPGQRLALHALKNQYPSTALRAGGKAKDLVVDGPMFKSYAVDGDKVVVTFDSAEGGILVADTAFNRSKPTKGKKGKKDQSTDKPTGDQPTGFADPKVIENGEGQVKLFWLAGEDRVWHPATVTIDGNQVTVHSKAVKAPCGVSYGANGIGFQPCLYNKAMLPMTPFIQYDNKMLTTAAWPDKELKVAAVEGAKTSNKGGEKDLFAKMPILAVQFRENAVLQADKPVTIWGSTRAFGEWSGAPEKGDCKVHFEFGDIKKVIDVTPEMVEWKVTLPPMKAGPKPYTLKVSFTQDGEVKHERIAKGIIFGDVWYVAASGVHIPKGPKKPKAPKKPKGKQGKAPKVEASKVLVSAPVAKPSGPAVRWMTNRSGRESAKRPSRFSVCVSRNPNVIDKNGRETNPRAACWKDVTIGFPAELGRRIAAKTGRPVGIIFMPSKRTQPLIKTWIAADWLNKAPTMMEDYKTIGAQYRDNPYYLVTAKRYLAEWKQYWSETIPAMMKTKAVAVGGSWGKIPSMECTSDSTATEAYNVFVSPFTPAVLSGIIFLSTEPMVAEGKGANFGTEMSALANCFKTKFGGEDIPFIYTIPGEKLAPKITEPTSIKGKHTAIEVDDWLDFEKVIDAVEQSL